MEKKFLDIKVGDKVIVWDEYSHDYVEHVLEVDSIEYHEDWVTETNPKGMHCFGTDLEEEEWGDDYITQVHEGNFVGFLKDRIEAQRKTMWVCERCLSAIECHEGKQAIMEHSVDEHNAQESYCEWCDEVGFDTLFELI